MHDTHHNYFEKLLAFQHDSVNNITKATRWLGRVPVGAIEQSCCVIMPDSCVMDEHHIGPGPQICGQGENLRPLWFLLPPRNL